MKLLVTRINKGEVLVNGRIFSAIGKGVAVFAGIDKDDSSVSLAKAAEKVVNLRIFEDDAKKLRFSVKDKNLQVLCIPNFTLCANIDKGRRPSFDNSMPLLEAEKMFNNFVSLLGVEGVEVKSGDFGAHMDINLDLDGPVNIVFNVSDK